MVDFIHVLDVLLTYSSYNRQTGTSSYDRVYLKASRVCVCMCVYEYVCERVCMSACEDACVGSVIDDGHA